MFLIYRTLKESRNNLLLQNSSNSSKYSSDFHRKKIRKCQSRDDDDVIFRRNSSAFTFWPETYNLNNVSVADHQTGNEEDNNLNSNIKNSTNKQLSGYAYQSGNDVASKVVALYRDGLEITKISQCTKTKPCPGDKFSSCIRANIDDVNNFNTNDNSDKSSKNIAMSNKDSSMYINKHDLIALKNFNTAFTSSSSSSSNNNNANNAFICGIQSNNINNHNNNNMANVNIKIQRNKQTNNPMAHHVCTLFQTEVDQRQQINTSAHSFPVDQNTRIQESIITNTDDRSITCIPELHVIDAILVTSEGKDYKSTKDNKLDNKKAVDDVNNNFIRNDLIDGISEKIT
ncbi:hypothetical protein HELRODRAFT_175033 [Helobdella robusta]|uniref:Uncharacterized protein n=1 Tax=Helobdella robusta TaxID=6412 RepID=T1F8R4_HELRO|nr:hypothetical protein HELRODRAFT_175033 [Helobdella robusta]ESO01009.1 hypothetical protein HELRODRAFT_175033 [Helobdella robusta]